MIGPGYTSGSLRYHNIRPLKGLRLNGRQSEMLVARGSVPTSHCRLLSLALLQDKALTIAFAQGVKRVNKLDLGIIVAEFNSILLHLVSHLKDGLGHHAVSSLFSNIVFKLRVFLEVLHSVGMLAFTQIFEGLVIAKAWSLHVASHPSSHSLCGRLIVSIIKFLNRQSLLELLQGSTTTDSSNVLLSCNDRELLLNLRCRILLLLLRGLSQVALCWLL